MNLHEAAEILRREIGAPLVVFDLETTGVNVEKDRIVQISLIDVPASGGVEAWTRLVNPGMPIPAGASAVHEITDEMVAQAPPFAELGHAVAARVNNKPLVAYNGVWFDIPLLTAEMQRAEVSFAPGPTIDPFRIWKKLEPRNLSTALERFTGETLEDAHSAEADSIACMKALAGMLEFGRDRIPDASPAGLAEFVRDPDWIDEAGKLRWVDGVATIAFGKYSGTPLAEADPEFLRWMLRKDFHSSTKAVVRAALAGAFPRK